MKITQGVASMATGVEDADALFEPVVIVEENEHVLDLDVSRTGWAEITPTAQNERGTVVDPAQRPRERTDSFARRRFLSPLRRRTEPVEVLLVGDGDTVGEVDEMTGIESITHAHVEQPLVVAEFN